MRKLRPHFGHSLKVSQQPGRNFSLGTTGSKDPGAVSPRPAPNRPHLGYLTTVQPRLWSSLAGWGLPTGLQLPAPLPLPVSHLTTWAAVPIGLRGLVIPLHQSSHFLTTATALSLCRQPASSRPASLSLNTCYIRATWGSVPSLTNFEVRTDTTCTSFCAPPALPTHTQSQGTHPSIHTGWDNCCTLLCRQGHMIPRGKTTGLNHTAWLPGLSLHRAESVGQHPPCAALAGVI
jgi:hypothetical protein